MSLTVIFQGFEPDIFKRAFGSSWVNYGKKKLQPNAIIEESSSDNSDEEKKEQEPAKKTTFGIKKEVTAQLMPEDYWVN